MPWPSEIVPGFWRIRSPTICTIGVWMASMREGDLRLRFITMPYHSVALEASMLTRRTLAPAIALAALTTLVATAAGTLQTPEQFLGHRVGADNKLARWDKIVEYMKLAAAGSDRIRFRELGKTSNNNPFIALEISAPETLRNLDHYKQLERRLYFQG